MGYWKERAARDPSFREKERQRTARRKDTRNRGKYQRQYQRNRRATDHGHRLKNNLGNRIRDAISGRRKTSRTMELTGCSVADLIRHIERQFKKGMSWGNRSRWHIDHIRPCSSFDLTDERQQRICFHYSNLRPMWKSENMRKHSKREFLL